MFPAKSKAFWHCEEGNRSLLHIYWTRDPIWPFWTAVRSLLPRFTDTPILDVPVFFLLQHHSFQIGLYLNSILPPLLLAAHVRVADCWKRHLPPTISQWLLKVNAIKHMEDLGSSGAESTRKISKGAGPIGLNLRILWNALQIRQLTRGLKYEPSNLMPYVLEFFFL